MRLETGEVRGILSRLRPAALVCVAAISIACDKLPGRPTENSEVPRPEDVKSFEVLYADNCAGCHGKDGENGPATALANPEYESLIDDATLRNIIAKGQQGTLMPGFAQASGGPLTDGQVDVLAQGMRARWRKAGPASDASTPSYSAHLKPNPQRGSQLYAQACSRCHGTTENKGKSGSVLDGSFLGLISDQVMRTTVIAGRPDLGMPNWQNDVAGRPLSDQDITDLVAWMISQRRQTPGQPYAAHAGSSSRDAISQPERKAR